MRYVIQSTILWIKIHNIPYHVVILNEAYKYLEEHMDKVVSLDKDIVFISHKTTDSKVADMLKDFLVSLGVPSNAIFCSSIPGSDVATDI